MVTVYGATEAQKASVSKAIDKVPVSELSATASSLVTSAKSSEKEGIAVASVEAIVSKRPALAATLVATIAKAEPTVAAAAAAKAVELNPAQASAIARAAAMAAPKYAGAIVAAVSKVAPKQSAQVAEAVVQVVPSSQGEVAVAMKRVATVGTPQAQLTDGTPVFDESNKTITGADFPAGAPTVIAPGQVTEGKDYSRP